jgi:hypothetical protein
MWVQESTLEITSFQVSQEACARSAPAASVYAPNVHSHNYATGAGSAFSTPTAGPSMTTTPGTTRTTSGAGEAGPDAPSVEHTLDPFSS